jgi:triphosphatase
LRRKVRKHGKSLSKLDDTRLHRLRVRTKKLRYAAEFFSSLASSKKGRKQTRELIESLQALQDKLGVLNDLAVHHTLSLQIARGAGLPSAAPNLIARRRDVDVERLLQEGTEVFAAFREVKRFWKSWPSQPQAPGDDARSGIEPKGRPESRSEAA